MQISETKRRAVLAVGCACKLEAGDCRHPEEKVFLNLRLVIGTATSSSSGFKFDKEQSTFFPARFVS